jgi:hypothetical protein
LLRHFHPALKIQLQVLHSFLSCGHKFTQPLGPNYDARCKLMSSRKLWEDNELINRISWSGGYFLCCYGRDVLLFEDAGTWWSDMTSCSMCQSLQSSMGKPKTVKPAIVPGPGTSTCTCGDISRNGNIPTSIV